MVEIKLEEGIDVIAVLMGFLGVDTPSAYKAIGEKWKEIFERIGEKYKEIWW